MSWIKENKFIAGLGGATLLGAIILLLVGVSGRGKYEETKAKFDEYAAEVTKFEKLQLYPTAENRDGKRKALADYRQATENLQKSFEKFRPQAVTNISPQEFTTRLKAANDEVRKAFEEAGTVLPDQFFLGFESYTDILAPESATGILDFQLTATKNLLLSLAAAKPAELRNLYRPRLPEEERQAFTPAPTDVARRLPLELTFKCSEPALRAFVSAVATPQNNFTIIRSMRITNQKRDTPPRAEDAKFETAEAGSAAPAPAADPFSGGFVIPGEEPAAPGAAAPAAGAAAQAAGGDASGRILAQVLGNEEVEVFMRLDTLLFLPVKELPQP